MRTMGVDPGGSVIGYAVMDGDDLAKYGRLVITQRKTPEERLAIVLERFGALLDAEKPDHIMCEAPFVHHHPKSVIGLARVGGVILAQAGERSIPVTLVPPSKVKNAAGVKGNASKDEVIDAVMKTYSLTERLTSDEADAIALLTAKATG